MLPYTPYVLPSNAGMTVAFGSGPEQTLPAAYLCTLAQAKMIQAVFGGVLVNAAVTPSIGTFVGISPDAEEQPYWLINLPSGANGPCGPRVVQQYEPNSINGGGMGANNTGSWTGEPGDLEWTPTPPPAPVAVPLPSGSGGVTSFMGVSLEPAGSAAAPGASALTVAQAASLAHIEAILVREFGA